MFFRPTPVARQPCRRCHQQVRVDRLIGGLYGEECATLLGLTGRTTTTDQHGPTLLDLLDDEPEDHCDGHDR